jgi:hypothetical protein
VADPQMYVKVAANIDQLKAAMTEARAEIHKVGDETKGFADQFASRFEHLGERVAEAFALREIAHFVEDLFSAAHALEVLSLQTGIDVEELQRLGAATEEYGLDSEKLGTLIFQLSRRIAGDDQSAAAALHMMGLTLDEVKGLNGEELFLTIARGLNTLHGNAVDLAATDLFGGRAGKSVIAFSKDVDGAMAAVKGSVSIASQQSVKDLADMDVQITRTSTSLKHWAIEVVGHSAQELNVLTDAQKAGASALAIYWATVKDATAQLTGMGSGTENMTRLLLDHNFVAKEGASVTRDGTQAHHEATVALDARAQAEKFMTAVILDNAKPILEWQRQDLDQLREMGALTARNAEAIGVNAAQLKLYEEGVKASTEATKQWNAIIAQMDKETFTLAMEHEKQWRKEQQDRLKLTNDAVLAEFDAQKKLNAEWGLNAAGAIQTQSSALDVLTQKLSELHASQLVGISQEKQEQVLMDAYTQALYDEAVAQDAATAAAQKMPAATAAADAGVRQFMNTLVLGIDNLDQLNVALDAFYDQFVGNNGSVGTPGGGNVGTPGAQGMPRVRGAAHRAEGGPVSAGAPYIVGEVGPELFVPSTAGTIVPNGGAGGGIVNHITVNVTQPLGTPREIARVVGDAIISNMKHQGLRLPYFQG